MDFGEGRQLLFKKRLKWALLYGKVQTEIAERVTTVECDHSMFRWLDGKIRKVAPYWWNDNLDRLRKKYEMQREEEIYIQSKETFYFKKAGIKPGTSLSGL